LLLYLLLQEEVSWELTAVKEELKGEEEEVDFLQG
jgi:hypothetical protein